MISFHIYIHGYLRNNGWVPTSEPGLPILKLNKKEHVWVDYWVPPLVEIPIFHDLSPIDGCAASLFHVSTPKPNNIQKSSMKVIFAGSTVQDVQVTEMKEDLPFPDEAVKFAEAILQHQGPFASSHGNL